MRNHVLVAAMLLAPLGLLGGCSGSTPSGPDAVPAAGGERAPVVASTEPSLVPPNATLDLRVFGSGFDDGSRVDVVTGGEPSPKVRTDSTRFVSEGEVVATITTAPDIPFGGYDIVLTDSKGKQGIGTELIDVDSTSGIQVNTRTTSTSYADEPRGGYDILIDGVPSGGHPVAPTGSAAVTGLSGGEHSVGLDGVAEHCAVSGDNPRTVSVPKGAIVQMFFDISCTPPPSPPPPPPPATGDVLAFTGVSAGGNSDIYWMTPEGLGPVNLTNSPGNWEPDWSPDGSRIVFLGDSPSFADIYTMRDDGSDVRHLTKDEQWKASPRWSPDGSTIAFVSGSADLADLSGSSDIYIMHADGSDIRQLTTDAQPKASPRWSPDGSKIAFTGGPLISIINDQNIYDTDLYVMNSDGTGRMRLTTGFGSAWNAAWSPDGSRIAYVWATSVPDNPEIFEHSEIFVVYSDGSGRVKLTSDPSDSAFDPAWSPDGSKIAFGRVTARGDSDVFDSDIFVMDANGGNLRRLTTTGSARGPVWSPDGSRIAFSLDSPGVPTIAIMNSDGTDLRTLVPGYGPTWRPRRP
jgi:TolB protein